MFHRVRRFRLARPALAAAGLASAASLAVAGGGAAAAPPRAALPGELSGLTGGLSLLGPAPAGQRLVLAFDLRLRREAALDRLIRRVSNPASPAYAHYLSPVQFRRRFAPSPAAAAAVERFARAHGFRVTSVPANRHYVAVTGTVGAAEAMLRTRLARFRLAGTVVRVPLRAPTIPARLAGIVTAVQGLNTADQARPLIAYPSAPPPPAFVNAPPCSRYFGEKPATGTPPAYGRVWPYAPCGYTPAQLQRAYGFARAIRDGITGRGVTVAVVDAYDSPTMPGDLNTWSHRHGLPFARVTRHATFLASHSPEIPGTFVDPQGWAGEEELDVEAVHAMAPGARLVYDGASSPLNMDLTAAVNDVVDNARAQIVTNSYGSSGDFDNSSDWDPIFKQAAAEGIGIYFSSGDAGDETKDPNGPGDREVDSPANDPLVTAVGGTSLAVRKGGRYGFEDYWGTGRSTLSGGAWSPAPPGDYLYGGGGGVSQTYAQPAWQRGIVPDAIARYFAGKPPQADAGDANGEIHVPGRAVPDVSMVGDPNTGFLEGITQDFSGNPVDLPGDDIHYGEYRIGGTSLSSPLFAGVMALADQAAGRPHGFANPALYLAFREGAYRDIVPRGPGAVVRRDYANGLDASGGTTVTLRSFGILNTLHLLRGYDDSTGLGSPHGLSFLRALAPGSELLARHR